MRRKRSHRRAVTLLLPVVARRRVTASRNRRVDAHDRLDVGRRDALGGRPTSASSMRSMRSRRCVYSLVCASGRPYTACESPSVRRSPRPGPCAFIMPPNPPLASCEGVFSSGEAPVVVGPEEAGEPPSIVAEGAASWPVASCF